ncbi:MAG: transporter substrate-binding domain-containing protein [Clostridia bacterium]
MKKNKLIVSLILVVLVVALVTIGCGKKEAANTLQAIKDRGEMIAGLDDTFAPMGFHDEATGDLVGFDIDMGNEIAKRLGVKMTWVPTEWKGVIGALDAKKFDLIISGMSVTEERKAQIDFSLDYVNAGIGVVTRLGDNSIVSAADLSGKKIGTQTGSSGATACTDLGLKDVQLYDQYPQAFMDLQNKRIDALIVDVTTAAHFVSKQADAFQVVNLRLVEEPYAIGMRKGDKELKAEIDKILQAMSADGTLQGISKKWFGADVIAVK